MRPTTFAVGRPAHGDTIPDLAWYRADGQPMESEQWHDTHTRVVQMLRSGAVVDDDDLLVVINGSLDQVEVTLPDAHGRDWHLTWDSSWAFPRPHTSAFALARRVGRGQARNARVATSAEARAARTGMTDCRQDRPGDTTTLDALSLRLYLSGEPLI